MSTIDATPETLRDAREQRLRLAAADKVQDATFRAGCACAIAAGRSFVAAGMFREAERILEPIAEKLLQARFVLQTGKGVDLHGEAPRQRLVEIVRRLRVADSIDGESFAAIKEAFATKLGSEAWAVGLCDLTDWALELVGDLSPVPTKPARSFAEARAAYRGAR